MVTKTLELYHTSIKIIIITRIVEIHTNMILLGFTTNVMLYIFDFKSFEVLKTIIFNLNHFQIEIIGHEQFIRIFLLIL